MFEDNDVNVCNSKHYGPVLYIEAGFAVMRCSFCEQIIRNPITPTAGRKEQQRSSRTCVSDCDWQIDELAKIVKCRSCSYTGPLPG
jgi:hypothetical protein